VAKSADATSLGAAASRAASVSDDLLGAQDASVSGIVCSDMYAVYGCGDQLRFTHAWCWAHVRSHIIRAAKSAKSLRPSPDAWLTDITSMYTAWHARQAGADDRAGLDAAISVLRARLDDQVAGAGLLVPRAAKNLEMIEAHWDGQGSFATHPETAPDNNTAQRALRPEVLLPKNCRGTGVQEPGGALGGRARRKSVLCDRDRRRGGPEPSQLPARLPRRPRRGGRQTTA